MTKGAKYILIATCFFALMNLGVKYISHIPAHEIVFFRAFISLVVCYLLVRRKGISPWGKNKRDLICRGLAGTVALTMYFYTLQNMPLASAVTIQHLSPIFTIIIAGFMLKETTRPIQWLFFILSFSGVLMIKGFDTRVTPLDLLIGVGSAGFSGLAYNFIRRLRDTDDSLVVVFYFPLVTVPLIGSYTIFHWVTPEWSDWLVLLFIGLATTVAQIFMTRAYQLERASNVTNFNYLGIVYALILGFVLFGEMVAPLGLIGIAVIVAAVLLSNRFKTVAAEDKPTSAELR